MLVDHLRQMLVEPLLEHWLQHLADHVLERIDSLSRGHGGGDGLQLRERLAAVTGDVLVETGLWRGSPAQSFHSPATRR